MFNDSLQKTIEEIYKMKNQLISDYGVDEPVRLVNIDFQKRFVDAEIRYNIVLSFPEKAKDAEKKIMSMYRGYLALQKQLETEGVKPLPVDTWKLKHTETDREAFICKNEAGKKNVQKQFGKYAIVLSADELLNMIDHEIFLEFVKLTKQGLLPKITSYSPKADKNKIVNDSREKLSDWDIDLKFGEDSEHRIKEMLSNGDKLEIKTERDKWYDSGNIYVEIESRGKASGLETTKADYWVINLNKNNKDYCKLFFEIEDFKKITHKYRYKLVNGGDNGTSKGYLIPIKELFDIETLKLIYEQEEM